MWINKYINTYIRHKTGEMYVGILKVIQKYINDYVHRLKRQIKKIMEEVRMELKRRIEEKEMGSSTSITFSLLCKFLTLEKWSRVKVNNRVTG
jgi:hypothetical protein